MKTLYMKKPCENCPFIKSDKGIDSLGRERAKEIIDQNKYHGFVCHKTANYDIPQGQEDPNRKQCAGALILAKKLGTTQPFLDLYEDMFGEMEFDDLTTVVDSEKEFEDKQDYSY